MHNLPGKGKQNYTTQEQDLNMVARSSKSGSYFNRNNYNEEVAVDAEFI
jgi:hypothetical protein